MFVPCAAGLGCGDFAYSDEIGDSGKSVYSGDSGYFGLSGDSCESDIVGESGNFGEYYHSRKSDWSGVCRLSDPYG